MANGVGRISVAIIADFDADDWTWLGDAMPSEIEWHSYAGRARHRRFGRTRACFRMVWESRRRAMLVSHGPYVAFLVELFRKLLFVRTPHVVYSFNFPTLPTGLDRLRWRLVLPSIDEMVVSAEMERALYARWFGIPPARLTRVLWSVDPPDDDGLPRQVEGDYLCAIGGNARDYPLFMAAVARLPHIPVVAVVRPRNLAGLDVPGHVRLMTDIPFPQAMAVMRDSRLMVVPLVGSDTPCGHVTLVAAQYMGVPMVVTRSTGVGDYLEDGKSALLVEQGSVDQMVAAIDRLWNDAALRRRFSEAGVAFATERCSPRNYVEHFLGLLSRVTGRALSPRAE